MAIEPKQLTSQLDQGKFSPLYFLYGEETFMIDEALVKIREKILADGLPDFNLNIFYAADCNVDNVRDAVETLPMMASQRLVIVKEAQEFSAAELEKLTELVEKPVDSTSLVFVASKVDMRKKFFKL